jgi:hypothetical protein
VVAIGSSAGVTIVDGSGRSLVMATGTVDVTATAEAVSVGVNQGNGISTCTATAVGAGQSLVTATGRSDSAIACTGVGLSLVTANGIVVVQSTVIGVIPEQLSLALAAAQWFYGNGYGESFSATAIGQSHSDSVGQVHQSGTVAGEIMFAGAFVE